MGHCFLMSDWGPGVGWAGDHFFYYPLISLVSNAIHCIITDFPPE